MKVAVVVDSTSYLSEEILAEHNIFTIPLNVVVGDKTFKENEIDNKWYYAEMAALEELPTTSQPSIGDYILLLESLYRDGYTDVISFHLSAEISGTCQSARAAAASVDGINVHVVDSEIAAAPLGFLALYAAQNLASKPLQEVLADVNDMKEKHSMNAFFLVDTLTNLQKGGRLSNAQAFIGGLLKIKPILEFQNGKIVAIEKIRTQKKAMLKIEEMLQAEFDKHEGKELTACLIHANAEELGMRYKQELEEKFPQVKFVMQEFGPVVGTHLGEGALGIGFTTYKVDVTGL
ncbi:MULTISPECIES: DegV family protein [Jeotgalicoccus]|jgi:EDD domain protein, DegV family|uniref:DegV family protein n=1 Tax=Jeotgalicoccus nanhaiensis TaxID=568603 RepID=A0ABR9XVM9_9STAP|nr:DegV family protein [Jeotgalicoccus nanhaiensis]MBF0753001.1 DegV family protein [Jeotgalicoccus nanhaiensis]TFU63153.1 DegV family protein [Jeotgalicoccus nanhaiensis]